MRELRVAESAGFCFGVQRSVELAEKLLAEHGACASLGELIHNEDVVRALSEKGMRVISDPDEAEAGERVLIRAHGVSPERIRALEERGAVVTDATCPKVKAIHKIVSRASEEGRFVLIVGMKHHPEVEAICGWCGEHLVVENAAELAEIWDNYANYWEKPLTLVVQTTQTRSNFTECCDFIKKRCTNVKISDTICLATFTRQDEAARLAAGCDAMIVIGGKHSANSVHLAQICGEHCDNVQFIERTDELDMSRLRQAEIVGLTAGASTPAWIIKEVRNKMSDEIKIEESAVEKEMSFDEMLEETLKPIYNGDKVSGTVVAITGTEISVDLGAKQTGVIPAEEFTEGGAKLEDAVKLGDTVEAVVVRVNDVEGVATLSKKRLDAAKVWADVEAAVEDGTILEGVVTEDNKGGVVVSVKGVRVFVPASQTDLPRDASMAELLKKTVRLKITEVNKARKRVVGSIRRVAQAERRERTEAIWNEIEVGKKYHGVVKSLTSYGAFVDIGGIDGMVHVSELSWGRIHQPSEVLSVGDEVDVYVVNFEKEKRKISLGYKDPDANPWKMFTDKYGVGDIASVKIVKLMPFGAFAEVLPGVDGLIHISQIANRRIGKPEDVLTVGDVVDAKITAIDDEKHKISLSIRALGEPAPVVTEEEAAEPAEPAEDALVYEVSESGEASGEAPAEAEE
jgi:4-hydroxy-3-methylbut-2-enyl diphosphate reductase